MIEAAADRGLFQRYADGSSQIPRPSIEWLKRIVADEARPPQSLSLPTYGLALQVLRMYFGVTWSERHIMDDSAPRGFLNQWDDGGFRTNASFRRIIDLAEMLVNMQNIPFIHNCMDQVQAGAIESAFAELEVGKILFSAGKTFRYVTPVGKAKSDFDIAINLYDLMWVCADVKAKIESTAISSGTIVKSLKRARSQLPDNFPGVVFLKLPSDWFTSPTIKLVTEGVGRFFNDTRHVVTVMAYFSHDRLQHGRVRTSLETAEYYNIKNRFGLGQMHLASGADPLVRKSWIDFEDLVGTELFGFPPLRRV